METQSLKLCRRGRNCSVLCTACAYVGTVNKVLSNNARCSVLRPSTTKHFSPIVYPCCTQDAIMARRPADIPPSVAVCVQVLSNATFIHASITWSHKLCICVCVVMTLWKLSLSNVQQSFELRILPHLSLIAECLHKGSVGVGMKGQGNMSSPAKYLRCREDMCYRLGPSVEGVQVKTCSRRKSEWFPASGTLALTESVWRQPWIRSWTTWIFVTHSQHISVACKVLLSV
jgi:hypothetical protein